MLLSVTWGAQSDAVCWIISQFRVFPPRFDVVCMQFAAPFMAVFASPVVPLKNRRSECFILRAVMILGAHSGVPTRPVWMIWSHQMPVFRGAAPGSFRCDADVSLMLLAQRALSHCYLDRFRSPLPYFRRCQFRTVIADLCYRRKLCFDSIGFGWVISKIAPAHLARIATEFLPPTLIR